MPPKLLLLLLLPWLVGLGGCARSVRAVALVEEEAVFVPAAEEKPQPPPVAAPKRTAPKVTTDDALLAPLSPPVLELPPVALKLKRPLSRPQVVQGEVLPPNTTPPQLEPPVFVVGDRLRMESLNLNQALPTSLVSQQQGTDRASLEDPTQEEGMALPTTVPVEERTVGVPFQRQTIPDPFENYAPVRLPNPLPETPTPPVSPIRLPRS